jgi:hypothetical protein
MALGGEHPKTIQTVLRHSSITLSMDTYGHLFPGQESAAVNKLHATMVGPSASLLATGTADDVAIRSSQSAAHAQRAGRETLPERASRCDAADPNRAQKKPPKSRPVADLSGVVRPGATPGTSSGGGTRTTPRTLRFGGGFGDARCNFRRKSADHRVDCRPATTATHSDRS